MAERDPRVDSLKGEPEMSDIKQSCAGDAAPWVMAYECRPAVNALVVALRPFLGDREFIVFRDAFRWKRDNGDLDNMARRGDVICNGYEMHQIETIADLCGDAEIIWDFNHVAVLRARKSAES
jgi:hypothetical protein